MYWKLQENNVKNYNNIDLKCLIGFASRMKFSKVFDSLTPTKKKNTWSFLFWKKIPLNCFYLQLEFDHYEHNCQPQVLVWNIAEKDLVSSGCWSQFFRNLLIDWIESCLNHSTPPKKEIFFSVKAKKEKKINKRVWSL